VSDPVGTGQGYEPHKDRQYAECQAGKNHTCGYPFKGDPLWPARVPVTIRTLPVIMPGTRLPVYGISLNALVGVKTIMLTNHSILPPIHNILHIYYYFCNLITIWPLTGFAFTIYK
jgi:hypothetical protein